MIKSFGDRNAKAIYEGTAPKGVSPALLRSARIRLSLVAAASRLGDLGDSPPDGPEELDSLSGLYSVRVNGRYRIAFRWRNGHAEDVSFVGVGPTDRKRG